MEGRLVVGAGRTEGEKVLCGLGDGLAVYLDLDVAVGGVQLGISIQWITRYLTVWHSQ